MEKRILINILTLGLIACTQPLAMNSGHWNGKGELPPPPSSLKLKHGALPVGEKDLVFETQQIDGVVVEGSFYKRISEQGRPEYVGFNWVESVPLSLRRDLLLMKAQKPFVYSHFIKKHEIYAAKKKVGSPELIIEAIENPLPQWRLIFEEKDGALEGVQIDRDFNILERKRLGSEFIDGSATIFPKGPLKSQIQDVLLQKLLGDKTLTSSAVKVTTESNKVALSDENNQFRFGLDDGRFDQVQVFFYISQALSWVEKNLSFQLPFLLEAETQKGFPEKTNTAFYFRQKIRLGDGDGEIFARIPMDASIVTHEAMHAVVDAVSGLPFENEGGSLNEAFADFFTAIQLKNPKLGEVAYKKGPFKRTIENADKLSDKNGGLYHDSVIVSGLLWEASKSLGEEVGAQIAWQVLMRMNPNSKFEDFKVELISVLERQPPAVQKAFSNILKNRGWIE